MKFSILPHWKFAIERALELDPKSNVFQLATVVTPGGNEKAHVPRVRSLIHRGFFAPDGRSPAHPLLITSTDIRTPKASQIAHNAPVEIAWWIPKSQEQFRISGVAYILPSPEFVSNTSELKGGKGDLAGNKTTEIVDSAKDLGDEFVKTVSAWGEIDWESKRLELFDAMSGHMKASWLRPVPGSSMETYDDLKGFAETVPKVKEANGVDVELVQAALKNFALVVIDPNAVDHVELGVVPNHRTTYTRTGEGWNEEIVVP